MPIAYPYKFSDWYGYDKDCVSVTGFLVGAGIVEGGNTACSTLGSSFTYYHTGSGTYPANGDIVYTNSAGAPGAPATVLYPVPPPAIRVSKETKKKPVTVSLKRKLDYHLQKEKEKKKKKIK